MDLFYLIAQCFNFALINDNILDAFLLVENIEGLDCGVISRRRKTNSKQYS